MKALLFASLVVAAHIVILVADTRHGMAVSYAAYFLIGLLALGASGSTWRRHEEPRDPRWWLLVASIALWMLAMALAARQSFVLGNDNPTPGDSMFVYVLYVLPVLVAISSAPVAVHKRWALAIDLALAALLGLLFHARTFALVSLHGADDVGHALELAWMLDAENACLALASLLRFLATDSPEDHRFFRALTAFFMTYVVAGFTYNHYIALGGHPQFGETPWDALLDLPFLALVAVLAMDPVRRHWHPPVYLVRFVQAASPTFLAMSVLTFGLLVMDDHPELGITAAIVAVVGIGLRGTLAQADLVDEGRRPSRAYDEPEGLVFVDRLTGLPNRRAFDERLLREWRRPGQQEPIALLVIDVDFFREYNQRYGRLAGDDCLRALIGMLLARGLRTGDFFARFGGEEFAVIAPATRLHEAMALADDLRTQVENQAILHPLSPFGVVTVTVGVAALRASPHGGALELVNAAERALQQARRSGHNRIGTLAAPRTESTSTPGKRH